MAKYWAKLPPAIISLILSHVSREAAADHTLARYAAVNKDWQYFFEQLTFRYLRLGPDDLQKFETIISIHKERRKWLRAVSFRDRADGSARVGGGLETSPLGHSPSEAVCSLLRLFKKWDCDTSLRLALYLSARTISSLENWRTAFHENAASLHLTNRPYQPEKNGLNYIIGEVPAVKSFSVQYQGREVTSTNTILSLCSTLPGLEELCLQDMDHNNLDTKHLDIAELTTKFPKTLKRLKILRQDGRGTQNVRPSVRLYLIERLIWFGQTTPLEELSITTSENAAEELFGNLRDLIPGPSSSGTFDWPALQSLTLTCSSLKPGARQVAVNRLLHQAGVAALGLPKLRQMLLLSYNTRRLEEVDGIFRYVVGGQGKAIATCFASKHIRMGRLVKETWRNAAWKSHRAVVRFSSDVHPQSSLLTVQGLFGEHRGFVFEEVKYPRPHWTASERLRNLVRAFMFFVVLVSFLSWLVTQMPPREQVGVNPQLV